MSIVERILQSLPVVSYNCLNFRNIFNCIPLLYVISIIFSIGILKSKKNIKITMITLLIVSVILGIIIDNGFVYFVIACLIFIIECYVCIINNRKEIIPFSLAMFAVSFSMIITPLYDSGRPNIYLHLTFIILMTIHIIDIIKNKTKIVKIFSISTFTILFAIIIFEIYELTYIGVVHKKRLEDINKAINENSEIVYLEKLKSPAEIFQIEPNTIFFEDYYSTKYYKQYYGIPNYMKIQPKE
ncbi:MAG: hypothetical protein J6A89_08965 [Clostridia bacterium]|nr:hypothetical protein [Clostridia bacterium]